MHLNDLFPEEGLNTLREMLQGRHINLCFGAGVDSTAMVVALKHIGIKPGCITFADTGAEKTATHAHISKMQALLQTWGWPAISIVKKWTLDSTGYTDLYGECIKNNSLPSLAFGMKACSQKWKTQVQDGFLMGVKRGPNKQDAHTMWLDARKTNSKIIKLIGYDCGKADIKRSGKISNDDELFEFVYPLQILGWSRPECVQAITEALGAAYVPVKSACFFCPASKEWELYWLAAHEPELLEKALFLERNALTGKHSRLDEVTFGNDWEAQISSGDRFPSKKTTVGLGRGFSWNQWAVTSDIVDAEFKVYRTPDKVLQFIHDASKRRKDDNALDVRS
jgi:hypothetical protein